ncbi:MAG: hypothetical protein AAAC48_19265 [Phyllobacterium sp.]|uniref:hypothetical protein n=1 Tax=Phyllobacterium sp. TaxID=1871046 RepID=UPI0030F3291D
MNWRHSVVVSVACGTLILGLPINKSNAAEKAPFVYFATSDPFLKPGEVPRRNGGPFAKDPFGGALRIFGAHYTQNYLLGVTYGWNFYDLGAGFLLGGVAGAAIRCGTDDDTSGEAWAGMRVKHQGLVIGNVAISPAFAAGFRAVTGETEIEKRREQIRDGDASFLGFLGPELSVRWSDAPNLELASPFGCKRNIWQYG